MCAFFCNLHDTHRMEGFLFPSFYGAFSRGRWILLAGYPKEPLTIYNFHRQTAQENLHGQSGLLSQAKHHEKLTWGRLGAMGIGNDLTGYWATRVVPVAPNKLHSTCTPNINRQDAKTGRRQNCFGKALFGQVNLSFLN